MEDQGEQLRQSPYEYFRNLPMEAIQERLAELNTTFEQVQSHYTGFIGRFRKNMRGEDQGTLVNCVGDLLPMSHNRSVQEEIMAATEQRDDLAFHRIARLQWDIMMFMGKFENTGVTIIEGSDSIFG